MQRTSRPVPGWFRWSVPRGAQQLIRCAICGKDVDRSIGGWVHVLWRWRCGGAALLGCCLHHRTGPGADGHARPGSREYRAGGQQTAQSRALAAGRLVFSERGATHYRTLRRCLSSRRCMRSWQSRGRPLSQPEATRPPPPSSLPSTAEWPGGTRAFPRWRERSRCTCAHETPPLIGTVRVSRPKPVSCLSRQRSWPRSLPSNGSGTSRCSAGSTSSLHLGRICPRAQSYVVLPQAWASPYQCLHMLPPFGQDVASVVPFSGRLASLPLRQAITTNGKDLKPSFTEGRNPFRFPWGKEQLLGYLQQQCTQWSRWAPRLANLRWGGMKVATSCMAFVCHALAFQHLHATRLWRGSASGAFHRTPMSSWHNS